MIFNMYVTRIDVERKDVIDRFHLDYIGMCWVEGLE